MSIQTKTTQHTPGPWTITEHNDRLNINSPTTRAGFVYEIAKCSMVNDKANARLIAAAPELLAALTVLVKMVEDGDVTTVELNQARAAIARAEGRNP